MKAVAVLLVVFLAGCIRVQVSGADPFVQEVEGPQYTGPLVEFTWTPTTPTVGQSVSFQPSVRVLKGTGISEFRWDFGDGSTSNRGEPSHAFATAGPKSVTLQVRSSDGLTGQTSRVVPVAAASATSTGSSSTSGSTGTPNEDGAVADPVIVAVPQGLSVTFSYAWNQPADSVGWDFGDGTTSQEPAPMHDYATPGVYRVALHVLREDVIRSATTTVVAGTPFKFNEFVVDAAVTYANDLYEPTLEVSDRGVIYITGHTILVDTTGAPVFASHDDGRTWRQLPFLQSLAMPGNAPGATPPPSDEIFLVAGDDGWLYGVDITLATFPVNAWSDDGTVHAYHNPNAYDESDAASCFGVPVKDRPWAAYANGTLLMVNNPASGRAQVGVLAVPPGLPAGIGAGTGDWNLCAGPGGSIPGIPDLRDDGLFAVPQQSDGSLHLVLGHKSAVRSTRVVEVFPFETSGEITSVFGIAAFDDAGDLFVGITNNTAPDAAGRQHGQLRLATSQDGGETFVDRTFRLADRPLRHFYMDGNDFGAGALVVWAVDGDRDDTYDWSIAHLHVASDGGPVLSNVLLALDEGPEPSAHVTGAAVGPDGRAYLALFRFALVGGTPLSVLVQQSGPTLPVGPV